MIDKPSMLAFGPVPSRRLGKSLGINNIPAKTCSYSCVYCQVGRTKNLVTGRKNFYSLLDIYDAVEEKIGNALSKGEIIHYLTFVSDGEPTLDLNLGKEIEALKKFGFKIAVITNASLLWMKEVRNDLNKVDWVSLKIDSVDKNIWRKINRPYGSLRLPIILQGIEDFVASYSGVLTTETMLVQHSNDNLSEFQKTADFITKLKPNKSYISIPTRPPAENWVEPATEYSINRAYQIFKEQQIDVEYLIGYEGNAFAFTGNAEDDLLSILSVHPMREDAVCEFLSKADENWAVIERLINQGKLIELNYRDKKFYMRMLPT